MATITTPAKLSSVDEFDMGCGHCEEFMSVPDGYIVLWDWDDNGPYTYIARCYYCNHRNRPQSFCSCH